MSESVIKYAKDVDGVVVLTLDNPGHSANIGNGSFIESLAETIARLEAEKDDIAGVIFTSAKKTFLAGADLNDLVAVTKDTAAAFSVGMEASRACLRQLETLGKPVVACINGAALGGGLELCLACHHRIVVDDPKAVVGFPEVKFGMLPGAGGIVRSVRMLGVRAALKDWLLPGAPIKPAKARELGLIDEIVPSVDDLVPAAKEWIAKNPRAQQPWDADDDYAIPGGTPSSPALARMLPAMPAHLRKQLKGASYPAPEAILAAAVEGAQVDFESALAIEARYFLSLATGQIAKNMIQGFFFDMQAVGGPRARPEGMETWRPKKVAVLGAGMMGAAIAYVCAQAGIEVVLKDVSLEAAERGRDYSVLLAATRVEKGQITPAQGDALLARIHSAAGPHDAAGADLVIEAVFEDPTLKGQVFAEIEPHLADGALIGSNTSTLPITQLAEGVSRPADFIGLHFFTPVDKMPLLEIIKGEQTSEDAVYRALDFAKQIRKTPIVVNDSRGFFTSRVIGTFLHEGIAMLLEGVPAATIEQASMQAGYPAPVLQLIDEVNLELMLSVRNATAEADPGGKMDVSHPAFEVVEAMVEAGRAGRLRGAGFYEYVDGKRAGLWPGLKERWGGDNLDIPFEDIKERMLFAEALESVKCLDEGVLTTVADANVGSLLGIGFPGWTGGTLQFINGYDGGPSGFVERCRELAGRYGERFEPATSLVARAAAGEIYTDELAGAPA